MSCSAFLQHCTTEKWRSARTARLKTGGDLREVAKSCNLIGFIGIFLQREQVGYRQFTRSFPPLRRPGYARLAKHELEHTREPWVVQNLASRCLVFSILCGVTAAFAFFFVWTFHAAASVSMCISENRLEPEEKTTKEANTTIYPFITRGVTRTVVSRSHTLSCSLHKSISLVWPFHAAARCQHVRTV